MLQPGDVITAVDGQQVDCHHDVVTMIRNRNPGAPVTLTIDRKGVTKTITLVTKDVQGQPVVGINLARPSTCSRSPSRSTCRISAGRALA